MPACRSITLLLSLLLAVLGLAVPAQAQQMQPPQRTNHIAAELAVSGPAMPGGTAELAILMTPEPTWHGYWSNPGDAGYGMELNWSLPPGWQAGEPDYPVPETLLISGLMNHVFEGQYAVLVPLTVPAEAAPGTRIPVTLEAEWLACTDEICVPERGTMATTISVGMPGSAAPSDPRFDGWRAAIPPMLDSHAAFQQAGQLLRIGLPLPATLGISRPHLFLSNRDLIDYAAPQRYWRDGDRLIVELMLRTGEEILPDDISGIIRIGGAGDGVRFEALPGDVPPGGRPLAEERPHELPNIGMLVLLALLGGLLLNIMPCVFPILSIKALSLVRAGESEAQARTEGLAYTAGVVVACLGLGALMLALRAAGNEIGWAFQLQEPGVVVALLLLAAAITANFAGLFEIPSLSLSGSGKRSGAFATGLLAAFVATPCTGPFMAAAMSAALLLPVVDALVLFAALGLGIALPFLLLGFVPPLRRLLPRPGAWMNTFRRVMAVPMGLTALALLWLSWRLGGAGFAVLAGVLALALLALLAFAGTRQRSGMSARPLVLAGLPVLALLAFLTLPLVQQSPAGRAGDGVIAAEPFSEEALASARASGKPVFVWFTADWCLTCKVNENVAIEREETRRAFEEAGVVALVGDWTRRDPEITRFLTAQGAAGVPLYLWYPAGGEAQQLPQVLTPGSLTDLAKKS